MNEQEILDIVHVIEQERSSWVRLAEEWEEAWQMRMWDMSSEDAIRLKKREQVTLPTPFNIVQLMARLISTEPRIEVPPEGVSKQSSEYSAIRERWLTGLWQRTNRERGYNVLRHCLWYLAVRGRCGLDVKWVADEIPERMRGYRLPIQIRPLDPINVGIRMGPFGALHAYHRYDELVSVAKATWPNYKESDIKGSRAGRRGSRRKEPTVRVTDYWWQDNAGDIHNAVLIEDKFVKNPSKTKYRFVPIMEAMGDSSPSPDERYRGMSILHPIMESWRYHNRLASQLGTAMLYGYWPIVKVTNSTGVMWDQDIEIGPDQLLMLPQGVDIDFVRMEADMNVATSVMQMMEAQIQMSSFPSVMYGQQPGDISAGYGINILANQARGRTVEFRENLETLIEHANMNALAQAEVFGEEGVPMWVRSKRNKEDIQENILPKHIDGHYANRVELAPEVPSDDIQRQTIGMRLVEAQIISKETYRDEYLGFDVPDDEDVRVMTEQILVGQEMMPKTILRTIQTRFPKTWRELIADTPLQQVAEREEMREAEERARKQLERLAKQLGVPVEQAMQILGMGGPPQPPAIPTQPPNGMGPIPGGPQPQPGMGPPPPQQMPFPGAPQQMPIQPQGIQGLPPQMAGQLTPEALGLPPGTPPQVLAELLGRRLPPEEEAGIPPVMPPGP